MKFNEIDLYDYIQDIEFPYDPELGTKIDDGIEKIFNSIKSLTNNSQVPTLVEMIYTFKDVHHNKDLTKKLMNLLKIKEMELEGKDISSLLEIENFNNF